ncbi:hypothetical protein RBU60_05695 [Mesonia sp. MT50]|uniref:Adhesin domain-containing protein n=1 Tax=Mesonia profundi TaxID=3070998 RepID=A0ABU1A033_9FLAO|nr:hypothetical protein [Mesonia profundi]MDQ7917062.1 hypothetical protein [Mesonia profundi]
MNYTIKIILGTLGLLFLGAGAYAQEKVDKLSETYKVENQPSVKLDTKHTQVVIETWNRNSIAVEAYVEADELSKEEVEQIAKDWKIQVLGNSNGVSIISRGGRSNFVPGLRNVSQSVPMASLRAMNSELIEPLMVSLVGPMLEKMGDVKLPARFYESMSGLKFDYEAYQKEGEDYIEKYEAQIEKSFGKDFEQAMEKWGKGFEKNAEVWSKQLESRMKNFEKTQGVSVEKWGEQFGKEMEQWGEQYGAKMEAWAQQFDANGGNYKKEIVMHPNGGKSTLITYSSSNVKPAEPAGDNKSIRKIIVVKMPKDATLRMDVRYGKVDLQDDVTSLKASVSYADFKAASILGENNFLNIAYSPLQMDYWEHGNLQMSYVKNSQIRKAKSIQLSSKGSDVNIGEIEKIGIISGSFGELTIKEVSDDFEQLDISLENSDLVLSLPKSSFNFTYNGSRSAIKIPKNLTTKKMDSYGNQLINGYYKSRNTDSNIMINAKFSDLIIK